MKLPKVIGLVLAIHVAVIGALMMQPGCKSSGGVAPSANEEEPVRTLPETRMQDSHEEDLAAAAQSSQVDPAFNAGMTEAVDSAPVVGTRPSTETTRTAPARTNSEGTRPRLPPTRPSWDAEMEAEAMAIDASVVNERNAAPVQSGSAPVASSGFTYEVQKGDSLWKIANKHSVSLDDLLAANGMTKNSVIHPGQTIEIPGGGSARRFPSVSSPSTPRPASQASGYTYTVLPGDTLSVIAREHHTTIKAIQQANNLRGTTIRAGQELYLPEGASEPDSPVNLPPSRNTRAEPTAKDGLIYKVKKGDNLTRIARAYGVTVKELIKLNNIDDPRSIRVGQSILIKPAAAPGARDDEAVSIRSVSEKPEPAPEPEGEDDMLFEDSDIPVVPLESTP